MQRPNIHVPHNFHKLVRVCTSSDAVFKSRVFRYVFIRILQEKKIPKKEIAEYIVTFEALIHNKSVESDSLLRLREICRDPHLQEMGQELFGQLEFTGVNSTARKHLREVLAIQEGHGDQTSKKIISQMLVMIYNILPQEILKTISDAEVEKEMCYSYEPHHFIDSFLVRKYYLEKGNKVVFDYQRGCFRGYGRTNQGVTLGFDEMGVTRFTNIFALGDDNASPEDFHQRDFGERIAQILLERFHFEIHRSGGY